LQRFAIGLVIGATVLVAVVFAAPATATASSPGPGSGPEKLWEQFPLDTEGDSSGAGGVSRDPGAGGQPVRRVDQVVPQAPSGEAGSGPARELEIVATAIVLLLGGVGAVLVHYGLAAARRRRIRVAPQRRTRSSLRAAVVGALDGIRNLRVLSRLAPPALVVMTSTGSSKAQQGSASDLEERPMVGPRARPAERPVVDRSSRVLRASPETPTPGQKTMVKAKDGGDLVSETDVLKAKTDVLKAKSRAADPLKLSKALPLVELEALRRKPAVDAVDAVKTKVPNEAAVDKERLVPDSTLALKEKLTATPKREQTADPPIATRTRERPPASLLHPIGELGGNPSAAPDAHASPARSQHVEVPFGDHFIGVARTQARRFPESLGERGISIGYLAFGFVAAVTAGVFAVFIAALLS
jgi:hypothetical protein